MIQYTKTVTWEEENLTDLDTDVYAANFLRSLKYALVCA